MRRKRWEPGLIAGLVFFVAGHVLFGIALAQDGTDWVTKFPRDPVQVSTWPGGKKVAVSFALFVEVFGFGQGPVFRPDLATRNPDLVNEAFRQYAVTWGNLRVARVFKELDVPLRAYPGSLDSWRGICSKSPEHDTDHGEADECSDSRCVAFEVASQTTVTTDPRERSFDDPPFG
jgi:hypothetical protein